MLENNNISVEIGNDNKILLSSKIRLENIIFCIFINDSLIYGESDKTIEPGNVYWFLPQDDSYLKNSFIVKIYDNDKNLLFDKNINRGGYLPFKLDFIKEEYNIEDIKGVIVVGAHFGDENVELQGIKNKLFFEPLPHIFETLKSNVTDAILVNKAVGNKNGKVIMNVEKVNRGQSSSILKPIKHLQQYPWITFDEKMEVDMIRLDNYPTQNLYNLMIIDVQGYELEVLKGAKNTLNEIDYIITEVNRDEVYENCAKIEDLDSFLSQYNFIRVETNWGGDTWGDALYIKEKRRISLAVTTYNRVDFTIRTFEKIYDDFRISEIIINDDCSDMDNFELLRDRIEKLDYNNKIRLFRNDENIGTGENKMKAISLCKNDWVIILDSDNQIDKNYTDRLYENYYWEDSIIYCPDKAGQFDYRIFDNVVVDKYNVKELIENKVFECLLNTCNYFVNKNEYLKVYKPYDDNVKSLDGIFFNYLWLKNDKRFEVIKNLEYEHTIHPGNRWTEDKEHNEKILPQIIHRIKNINNKVHFDIGANIGNYSKSLLLSDKTIDKIICVEANPNIIPSFQNNLNEFKDKIEIINKATSFDNNKEIDFYICKKFDVLSTCDTYWIEYSRFNINNRADGVSLDDWEPIKIKTTTIDDLVEEYGIPEKIKIDVEGYEFNVLKGMKKFYGCEICFEWAEEKYLDIIGSINYLYRLGYKEFAIQFEDSYDYKPPTYDGYFETVKKINDCCVYDRYQNWGMIHVK